MKSAVNKQRTSQSGASNKKSSHLKAVNGERTQGGNDFGKFRLKPDVLKKIYDRMLRARCLEERQIKMYKQADGYFWIGGPGEEAFNIPLGMQLKKGEGKDYDYLHLHYRSSGILIGMDILEPIDTFRQMKNTVTDPFSGGRNFSNHFSIRKFNVAPVASTIETQYQTAIGTGIAQARHGGDGLTMVNGGDAGTAEGDFASCLVWASRPINPLPILIIAVDNGWGISTAHEGQHGEKKMADRAAAFGIKNRTFNGNDVEESYFAIKEAMEYIRKERKPYFLEPKCSRLYGHSSASGANFHKEEVDCLVEFEKKLESNGILTREEMDKAREDYNESMREMAKAVKGEPMPDPSTIYDHTFYGQKGKYW